MNYTKAVEKMLENLDDWRHLPKYQLERRADLFFGLFVRDVVASHLNIELNEIIIPEFPYKNNVSRYTTVNFDYVLFSKETKTAYILELKTDSGSVDDEQLAYLKLAKDTETGLNAIVSDIIDVADNSRHDSKYGCLLNKFKELQLVEKDAATGKFKMNPNNFSIEILYLSPQLSEKSRSKVLDVVGNDKEAHIISFNKAADILEITGGAVECHFAAYLRRWNDIKAGDICHE